MVKKLTSIMLALCLIFGLSNSVFAAEIHADEISKPNLIVSEVKPIAFPNEETVSPFGATIPSSNSLWDLSEEDYSGTFNFDVNVYTNNRFINHNGNLYLYVYSYFTETYGRDTTGFTLEVNLVRKGILGNVYEDTIEVEIGKAWVISCTNWDADEDYYFIFSQPYDHRDCTVGGNFTISATNRWA